VSAKPFCRALAIVALVVTLLGIMPVANAAALVRGYSTTWSRTTVPISRGGAVRWNATQGSHNVRSYGGNWTYGHSLPQGTSTPPRFFNTRGVFHFYCTIHGHLLPSGTCSGMCGKVVVT
jgi:plastocyanin